MWAKGIQAIKFVDNMGNSPAAVEIKTGVIHVNRKIWNLLPLLFPNHYADMRAFILLHEYAHIELKSKNEDEVDARAFELYIEQGRSLKAANYVLHHLLKFDKPEHNYRMVLQHNRSYWYDKHINKNPLL